MIRHHPLSNRYHRRRSLKREYPEAPLVGVGVVILKSDSIVLVERGKEPKAGIWTIPGGLVEVGESVRGAAYREVLEECNIPIELGDVISVVDLIKHDDSGDVQYHYVLIDFFARYVDGELEAGSDVKAVKWVSKDQLDSYDIPEITRKVIEKAFNYRR